MKNIFVFIIALTSALLIGCDTISIVDNDYTPSVIYMSQSATTVHAGEVVYHVKPNKFNQPINFSIQGDQVVIPIGIVRSGVDLSGDIQVNIQTNNDTVLVLKNEEILDDKVIVMPSDQFNIPKTTTVKSGSVNQKFDLSINVNYLKSLIQIDSELSLALGISVNTNDHRENPKLSTTIFLINPSTLLLPVADFFSYSYNDGSKVGYFTNLSSNGGSYHWDFGDGSTSTEPQPSHQYANPGTYTVTMTVRGVKDEISESIKTQIIEIR